MRDYENSKKKTIPKWVKKPMGKGRTTEDDATETEKDDADDDYVAIIEEKKCIECLLESGM